MQAVLLIHQHWTSLIAVCVCNQMRNKMQRPSCYNLKEVRDYCIECTIRPPTSPSIKLIYLEVEHSPILQGKNLLHEDYSENERRGEQCRPSLRHAVPRRRKP
jgi:hypothetical protein